jgi:hypothetical protein
VEPGFEDYVCKLVHTILQDNARRTWLVWDPHEHLW